MKWITKKELILILLEMENRGHDVVTFDLRIENREVRTKHGLSSGYGELVKI